MIKESMDTEPLKRKRYSLKVVNQLLKDSEDDSETEESSDESEDEWNTKKRKRKSSSIAKISPVQTLKKKLAEKTKTLRKSIKQSSHSPVEAEPGKGKEEKAETAPDTKPILPVTEVLPEKKEEPMLIKKENTTKEESTKKETLKSEKEMHIKEDLKKENTTKEVLTRKETLKSEKEVHVKEDPATESSEDSDIIIIDDPAPKNLEPVVVTYSTSKNSSYISPFMVATQPQNTVPISVSTTMAPIIASNDSASQSSVPASPVPSASPSPSTGIARLRINPTLQSPRIFSNSLRKTAPVTPTISPVPVSPRNSARTPTQRTPRSVPRSPSVNTSFKPRKLFDNSAISNTRVTPRRNTPSVNKVPAATLKNPSSLNRISPNGTIIYHGSNSVTITPRKKSPERRPSQRQLIKTDVEGIIAARVENGVMQYVINLANGKHLPLTNLQVIKLREQNNGVLPAKLKIPVPSDVASQIEPRFVIDD